MKLSRNFRYLALVLITALALATIYWLSINYYYPQTRYFLYRAGLGEKSILEDTKITMGDGWFPTSPETAGRYPTLIFHHVQWNRLGSNQSIGIRKHKLPPAANFEKWDSLISYTKDLPWGRVYFVRTEALKRVDPSIGNDDDPYKVFALVPSMDITISSKQADSLNAIVAIEKTQTK
jgi:hypothetical protein